jgi:hypothetical protein
MLEAVLVLAARSGYFRDHREIQGVDAAQMPDGETST